MRACWNGRIFFVADLEVISKIYHHFNTDIYFFKYNILCDIDEV